MRPRPYLRRDGSARGGSSAVPTPPGPGLADTGVLRASYQVYCPLCGKRHPFGTSGCNGTYEPSTNSVRPRDLRGTDDQLRIVSGGEQGDDQGEED